MPNSEGRVFSPKAGEQALTESFNRDMKDSGVKRSSELPKAYRVCVENRAGLDLPTG